MNIPKFNLKLNEVSFSGHKKAIDKQGYEKHDFYYLYDENKYKNCYVELFNIEKDDKDNLLVKDVKNPEIIEMTKGHVSVDFWDINKIHTDLGFAYRFKLIDNDGKESYAFDNGTVIGLTDKENMGNKFNVILSNRGIINKNGPMQLIMPDEYYPGMVKGTDGKPTLDVALRAKALSSVRNHANKLGGNFQGIIARLPKIKKEGINRIVGMPFTDDPISSHKYWTKNAFQISSDFGTEEDFKLFQKELFKNGINWISDAALVNEGFGGIHLTEFLRHGNNSVFKNMFRIYNNTVSLGVVPNDAVNTRMKIINAPFIVENDKLLDNEDYDSSKPTYIQFYDERLVSEEQKQSKELITAYENRNVINSKDKSKNDIYAITKHDDAVYLYYFEVSPSELKNNVKRVLASGKSMDLNGQTSEEIKNVIQNVTNFSNFNIVPKNKSGGIEVWDGNVDIAKLNFFRCMNDEKFFKDLPQSLKEEAIKNFDRGTLAVRDYAINSGKYWTQLTANAQMEQALDTISKSDGSVNGYLNIIKNAEKSGNLPSSDIDSEIVSNVLNGQYNQRLLNNADKRIILNSSDNHYDIGNKYSLDEYVVKKSMDVPLEILPFDSNLLGILTSPYIAKKANTNEELGVSRFDIYKSDNINVPAKYMTTYTKMDSLYENKLKPLIKYIVKDIQSGNDSIADGNNVSDYGKYVINAAVQDITKYLFVKSLNPNADIKINQDGSFDYSNIKPQDYAMQSLGIGYDADKNGMKKTPKEEANIVLRKLEKGFDYLSENESLLNDLKKGIENKYNKYSLNDFKMAEMIIDRTESGLGWRIDAAKDVGSIDSIRNHVDKTEDIWNNVTDFWKRYNQAVLEVNPHSYTTAEITDLFDLISMSPSEKYTSDADAEHKFLRETGITSVANYNFFFSMLPQLFSLNFEDGIDNPGSWMANQSKNLAIRNKLIQGWGENPGFLFQSPDDGVKNSYTFVGNHDKPRILHSLAVDMSLFNYTFSNKVKKYAHTLQEYDEYIMDATTLEEKRYYKEQKDNLINNKNNIIQTYEANIKRAAEVLKKLPEEVNANDSGMAVAMGERLNQAFTDVVENANDLEKIKQAVSELASGNYLGEKFDANAFGTRDFKFAIESVLNQVAYNNNGQDINDRINIESKTLENILLPAFDKMYSIYKLLLVLPGSPTDFAGDRVGASGYETKAKNYHQQNRNVINWEWLDDEKYAFVKNYYNNMNEISNIRNLTEKDKNLSALNNGDTIYITTHDRDSLQCMLRYNEDSVVLTLHDNSGSSVSHTKKLNRNATTIDKISLNTLIDEKDWMKDLKLKTGLKHGLPENTVFKRIGDENSLYIISKEGDEYFFKKADGQPFAFATGENNGYNDYNTMIFYKVDMPESELQKYIATNKKSNSNVVYKTSDGVKITKAEVNEFYHKLKKIIGSENAKNVVYNLLNKKITMADAQKILVDQGKNKSLYSGYMVKMG